jgi:hypothetical protein
VYFRKREPTLVNFVRWLALLAVIFWGAHSAERDASGTTISALKSMTVYLVTLTLSIGFYRAFAPYHPLWGIPGPFHYRFTQLFLVKRSINGQLRHDMRTLHERYGDVVRIGEPPPFAFAFVPSYLIPWWVQVPTKCLFATPMQSFSSPVVDHGKRARVTIQQPREMLRRKRV